MTDLDLAWEDVLRRARRGRGRRLALAVATAVVVLGAGSALGVLLTRPAYATLPPQADRTKTMVTLDPKSGRILLQVAPWRGHPGVCYVVLRRLAACTRTKGRHGTVFLTPPRTVIIFDRRVHSLTHAVRIYRFARLHIAFALPPRNVCTLALLDRRGRAVALLHLCR